MKGRWSSHFPLKRVKWVRLPRGWWYRWRVGCISFIYLYMPISSIVIVIIIILPTLGAEIWVWEAWRSVLAHNLPSSSSSSTHINPSYIRWIM